MKAQWPVHLSEMSLKRREHVFSYPSSVLLAISRSPVLRMEDIKLKGAQKTESLLKLSYNTGTAHLWTYFFKAEITIVTSLNQSYFGFPIICKPISS